MSITIQLIIQMCTSLLRWRLNLALHVSQGSASTCLGEVGILGTILLRVYSRTFFPIFIKIGTYFTDNEPKISWHSF